jgi:hypothetical protein
MEDSAEEGKEVLPTPTAPPVPEKKVGFAIGDTVKIIGGKLDSTVGKLYGFYPDRITVLPLGVTDRLVEIPLVGRRPDPELGIQEMKILKKAAKAGLIPLIDIQAGQLAETFTSTGEAGPTFIVKEVDEAGKRIFLEDDAGETLPLLLTTGIPQDLPFRVLRTRDPPVKVDEETGDESPELPPAPQVTPVTPVELDDKEILENGQVPSPEEDAEEAAAGPQPGAVEALDFMLGEEIELPADEIVEEKSTADRYYPDVFQRSEMLGHFIRMLPEKDQRNVIELQKQRRLVELFMIMRNDVVKYGVTGEPRGLKQTSASTLAELIRQPDVSMKRKVVNADTTLYASHSEKYFERKIKEGDDFTDPDPATGKLEEDGLRLEYQADLINRSEALLKTAVTELGREEENKQEGLPKFFQFLETYRKELHSPLTFLGQGQLPQTDEDAFLREVPNLEDKPVNVLEKGWPVVPPLTITQAGFSLRRLLKQRWGRFLEGEPYRVVESGDSAQFKNILLFPKSAERDIGSIRTGSLVKDVDLAMKTPESMEDILARLGDATEFPTVDGILNLGVNGNILGNVSVKDWLDSQETFLTGYGDILEHFSAYGLKSVELSMEQSKLVQEKVEQLLAAMRIYLTKAREEGKVAQENLKFDPQPLLSVEGGARLQQRVASEPLLQKVLEEIQERAGELAKIDVNWFSYIYILYPDFLLTVLGQQADQVAKERLRHVRDLYLEALRNGFRLRNRLKNAGEPPVLNDCPHVKAFEQARKYEAAKADEPRDMAKTKLLLKQFYVFRGKTEGDWVWCNVCDKHLMCAHEVLQLQEVIRVKEQEALHKELLIKFSGGQFGGKFICRNCGQGISDLDFDTNLEFDDEGRPMIGRSVMADPDQEEVDALEGLLKGPAEGEQEELDFGNEELNTMLKTMKRICGMMGISPEDKDYRQMIEEMSAYNNSLPTRDQYIAQVAEEKAKGRRVQDYDIFYSIRYVTAAAAIVLLNTQTHIPDYIRYYVSSECKDGFMGYPLEEESNQSGIQCLATVIASINDPEFPWNSTTLQRQPNLQKRKDAIIELLARQVSTFSKQPVQQAALKKKRDYQLSLYGKLGDLKGDQISTRFRPIPFVVSPEEAAAAPILAGSATPAKQATAWMRLAHRIAMENAALNSESKVSETTCCLHTITSPASFWEAQAGNLPQLEARTAGERKFRTSTASTTFTTEKPKAIVGKDDPTQYYKLFMRVCYQGENEGLPHRIGLSLTCSECGLNFQQSPYLPLTSETDMKKAAEERGKVVQQVIAHMEAQGLVITQELFERVQNTSHLKASVLKSRMVNVPNTSQTLQTLSKLPNPPLTNWEAILASIQVSLAELGTNPTRTQLAEAAQTLVQDVSAKEEFIRTRMGQKTSDFLFTLLQKQPRECGELLRAYFLVPFQRWSRDVQKSAFKILDTYDLSKDTKEDILERGLGKHLDPLGGGILLTGFLKKKVRQFVNSLSIACNKVFPELRAILTPGGAVMVNYIQRAYVIGYVFNLLDPHTVPETVEDEEEDDSGGGPPNVKLLFEALKTCILRFAQGSKVPSEEEIRISLEKRAEKEKQVFIEEQDKMSREERRVMQNLKKYGMGRWAVGGTKAIRQYDADRYEAERVERAMAGFVDYPELAAANAAETLGNAEFDMFGAAYAEAYNDAAERGDGGYDNDDRGEFAGEE